MKQIPQKTRLSTQEQNHSALILLSITFVVGGLLGCVLAASVSGHGSEALTAYIQGFMETVRGDAVKVPSVLSATWTVLRWPIIAVLLSFSSIGRLGIPALLCIRGFLFSFCVSAFVQVLGAKGLLFSVLLLGAESLLSIPVLFVLGIQGMRKSAQAKERTLKGKTGRSESKDPVLLMRYAICCLVLLFCILWELLILPMLLSGAGHLFPV